MDSPPLWRGLCSWRVDLCTLLIPSTRPLCQAHLLSAEFGKHLLEVEDLLQKHKLMEADIAIQGDKVKAINTATLQFTEGKGENLDVSLEARAPTSGSALWHPSLDKFP